MLDFLCGTGTHVCAIAAPELHPSSLLFPVYHPLPMRHSRPCSSPATHITCAPPCSYSSPAQRLSSTTTASLPPMPQIFPIESSLTHLQTAPAVASQNQPHRRSLSRSEIQFLPPAPPWPRPRPPYRPPTHENALPTVVYHHCWRSP